MRSEIDKSKRFLKRGVPTYVFDEHNEAFYFWHKAKYEGFLNEPLDLFHIDAHDDMRRGDVFKRSLYFPNDLQQDGYANYYQDFAKNELHISNFILPAVLNGLIKNVYFIYPKWRNFKPRRKKINISSAFGEGKILKIGINIGKNTDPRVLKAYPDLRYFNYSMRAIERIPKNRKVILDIDLDYFACVDSISNRMSYELEITEEQFLKKEIFLRDRTLPFSGLEFSFSEKNGKYHIKVAHKKVKDISYLPPEEEVESEIDTLVNTLQTKKIRPVVITICRSFISGFCPEDYYEFIETKLKGKLQILLNY
jgi:hypothetical protein